MNKKLFLLCVTLATSSSMFGMSIEDKFEAADLKVVKCGRSCWDHYSDYKQTIRGPLRKKARRFLKKTAGYPRYTEDINYPDSQAVTCVEQTGFALSACYAGAKAWSLLTCSWCPVAVVGTYVCCDTCGRACADCAADACKDLCKRRLGKSSKKSKKLK